MARLFPSLLWLVGASGSQSLIAEMTTPLDGIAVEVAVTLMIQPGPVLSVPPPLPVPVLPGTRVRFALQGLPSSQIREVAWAKNLVNLDAHGAELFLPSVSPSDTGQYLATVTTVDGDVILATRVLHVSAFPRQRLLNLSTRAAVNAADNAIVIAGFVIDAGPGDASSSKQLLIRAVGPSLRDFGVNNPLPDPALRLFRGDGTIIDVGPSVRDPERLAEAARLTGAAPLGGGADVAWLISLRGGVYTAQVSSAANHNGEVLVEIYEVPR